MSLESLEGLMSIGHKLALMQNLGNEDESNPSLLSIKAMRFIAKASWDCLVKARTVARSNEGYMRFTGSTVAAAMDHYQIRGLECYGYHELFFNALIGILHGVVGKTHRDMETQVRRFKEHRLKAYNCNRADFDEMTIDPDYGDDMLYVQFMHNFLADPPPVCDNLCFSFILPEKNEDKKTSAQDDRKKASKRRRSTNKGEDSSTSDIAMI